MTDTIEIAESQYGSSTRNLDARIELHQRFSVAAQPWIRWVFDRLGLGEREQVVEFGAGTGLLWSSNLDRVPATARLLLTDGSAAMCRALRRVDHPHRRVVRADAQRMPVTSAYADVAIANHMLYHVPDPDLALAEMARILRVGGRAAVTTNGDRHLRQIFRLHAELGLSRTRNHHRFPLDLARDRMATWFDDIEAAVHQDELRVTDPEVVVRYVASGGDVLSTAQAGYIRREVARAVAEQGAFVVEKQAGLLTARR